MPNYELNAANTAFVPIQTLDANQNPVPPPPGDTFTVTSSDPGLVPTISVMPSGPLQGQPAVLLTPTVETDPNVTITLSDSAGLAQDVQIVDVTPDVPVSTFLDISAAVLVPQTPPAAKPKA